MATIRIVGLGASDLEQLPLGVYRLLKKSTNIYLRTKEHPVADALQNEGISFTSFDPIYEQNDSFEATYTAIVNQLLEKAQTDDLIYAVPGHPFVAERTVQFLLQKAKAKDVHIVIDGGQSFLDAFFSAVQMDPIEGCQIVDGTNLKSTELQIRHHLIITQVYDQLTVSHVKLTLMELLPDDYEVIIVEAAGSEMEKLKNVPLYELDRMALLTQLTAVYVPPVVDEKILNRDFNQLREVVAMLRGPDGCPWDQVQTHESLKKHLIEETYEVIEAIDEEDSNHLSEELGDVLLQVMVHSQIGEETGYFTITDVISHITEKMIRRHPHVFSHVKVKDTAEVKRNWEKIKQAEKGNKKTERSHLSGVPKSLPALYQAFEYQAKAAKVDFDWDTVESIWEKVREELAEFQKAEKDKEKAQEFGDILFTFVNLARFYDIDPEDALRGTSRKFATRFQYIETILAKNGETLAEAPLERMNVLWERAKEAERE